MFEIRGNSLWDGISTIQSDVSKYLFILIEERQGLRNVFHSRSPFYTLPSLTPYRWKFLTMTPKQGRFPLVPRSPSGLSTPGSRSPASFTSVLITVRHARHAVSATRGQRSTDSAFLRKSHPAWCKFSCYTGSIRVNANWQRICDKRNLS